MSEVRRMLQAMREQDKRTKDLNAAVMALADEPQEELVRLIIQIKRHLVLLHEQVQAITQHLGVDQKMSDADARDLVAGSSRPNSPS